MSKNGRRGPGSSKTSRTAALSVSAYSVSSVLCSKKGLMLTIATCIFLYCVIFKWTASENGGILNSQQPLHQSVSANSYGGNKKPSTGKSLDPTSKEFDSRRTLYEKKCVGRREGYVWEMFIHSKLSVCHIPKAGSTFWKRLFRYLNTDHKRTDITGPFGINRIQAHFGPGANLPTYEYKSPDGRILVDASTKVMMVRSPYKRLWSAYIDKIVLPEWWLDHGKAIMFGRKEVSKMRKCPDDISFEEFLEYSLRNHERHWRPITELCDPCTYKPQYVVHADDSFMRDVKHILNSLGLGSLLEDYKEDGRFLVDIESLIDYHYQLYKQRRPLHDCLSEADLARILWKALQITGYYRMDHDCPIEKIEAALANETNPKQARDFVVDTFLQEFRRRPIQSEQEWKELRQVNFIQAYRNVSEVTKQKIVHRYSDDFDMFGYDTSFPDSHVVVVE